MKTIVIIAIVAILVIALVVLLNSLHKSEKHNTNSVKDVVIPEEKENVTNNPYYRTRDGQEYPVYQSENGALFIQKYNKKGIAYNMYIKKDRKQFIYYK